MDYLVTEVRGGGPGHVFAGESGGDSPEQPETANP